MSALLDGAVFPGTVGDLEHVIAAKLWLARPWRTAMEYILQVQKNAQAMAGASLSGTII